MHHRSGLPSGSRTNRSGNNEPMVCCYGEKELLRDLETLKLKFKPDKKASYSNLGFATLGYIFERVTDKTYKELLQKYVIKKYKLKNTTTAPNQKQKKRIATPYRVENRYIETKPWEMGKFIAAGGVYSSISDLSKLLFIQKAVYRNQEKYTDTNPLFLTKYKRPFIPQWDYGFGFFDKKDGTFGHGGDMDGFSSSYAFGVAENRGVIILTSSGGIMWFPQFEHLILKKWLGRKALMPKLRKTISLSQDKIENYVGEYLIAGRQKIKLVRTIDKLQAYSQGGFGPINLYFENEKKLFSKTFNAYFEFELGKNGKVKTVSYTFRGQKLRAKKLK